MVDGEGDKGAREFFEVMELFYINQSINISITRPLAALPASEPQMMPPVQRKDTT